MMTNQRLFRALLLVAALAPGAGAAATNAPPNFEEVLAAHGPLEALATYGARLEITDVWARQSREPDPPWQRSRALRCESVDVAGRRHAAYRRGVGAGHYPFHAVHHLGPHGGWRANLYDGWVAPVAGDGAADEIAATRRLAPVLLLAHLAAHRDALDGPAADGDGHARFRFADAGRNPMILQFDGRTRLLRRMSQGDIAVAYDEYESVGDYAVSRRMTMTWRGDTVWGVRLAGAAFNSPFPESLTAPQSLPVVEDGDGVDARAFGVREIGTGVYLVGDGVTYQVYVAFRDFLVALGGVAGVEKRLEAIREVVGDLPLRYALITHHHADHLEGVPALVDAGAVIVASPAHEQIIRQAAGQGRGPVFAFVRDRREITDGERTMVFLELGPMRHSRHMLGALIPEEKLLFTADLFVQPPNRPVRAANPPIEDLLAAVKRLDLDVTRFADTHTPVVSNYADLRLAASKKGDMEIRENYERALCPEQ